MWVELSDGHTLGVPLVWFPRLLHATRAQRLAGRGDETRHTPVAVQ